MFQSLSEDIGNVHLKSQLNSVITLLQVSDTWEEFISKFNKLIDHRSEKLVLDLNDFTDLE